MNVTSFAELGLRPELLRAVEEAGYTTPTPIQAQAIPVILAGKDVMGGAQTGTGKTAGFALPILQKLAPMANASPSPARHPVRALILTPTRELAVQVEESFRTYGKHTQLRSTVVFGGVDIKPQMPIVRGGVEILVATPGRLLDHIEQKSVNLGAGRDLRAGRSRPDARHGLHAGHQADHGAAAATRSARTCCSRRRSPARSRSSPTSLLNAPQLIEVAQRNAAAETVQQSAYKVPAEAKRALLEHLVRTRGLNQVLVLHAHQARRLAPGAAARKGRPRHRRDPRRQDASRQRMEALDAFKEGKLQVLVATDVAARGLDIDDLPLVVNYELPHVPEDYIHRIGRTGRAGASGEAISFVAPEEERYLADIERLLKKSVQILSAEGFDPSAVRAERAPRTPRAAGSTRAAAAERPPRAPRGEHAARPPRAPRSEDRAPRPPREDPRIERERAYALNPDQPAVAPATATATPSGTALAPTPTPPRRHGFGHGRPVPALLRKRTASEPEKV